MKEMVDEGTSILGNDQTPLKELGVLLNESWHYKRSLAKAVSNIEIDEMYQAGIDSGAVGGKLLGAGGGGFILFYAEPKNQKNIINNYEETDYVEEAIHRLVEVNYMLGLEGEAKKYAALLGYNYKSSKWYKESYRVFNKEYKDPIEQIKKDKQNAIVRKFKELFK